MGSSEGGGIEGGGGGGGGGEAHWKRGGTIGNSDSDGPDSGSIDPEHVGVVEQTGQ